MVNSSQYLSLLPKIREKSQLMTASEKKVAQYTLDNTYKVAHMSINELADEVKVSIATVNRFAKRCGFSGFLEFKKVITDYFSKIHEPIEKAKRVRKGPHEVATSLDTSFNNAMDNLTLTRNELNQEKINSLCNQLLTKKRVFIAGIGVSSMLASFLANAIEPFLPDSYIKELIGFYGYESAFRQISHLTNDDLVIIISIPRYSQTIVDLAKAVQEKQCTIIAITDSIHSPIAPYANECIFVGTEHPVLYASNVAMIAIIETISYVLALRTPELDDLLKRQTEVIYPLFYKG
ncbi:HTH-type transcriptional regulator MurR [Oligella urethralis]|uniref:MurR/RpiR family transcriptional regulator n=1 Tax=Oligella urethralis TaxID=90245 RepID=UPI00295835BC|nr:MurR/RpiR family transcriptional regulator [Oligella urethralis]WOS36878.1 HTH-type transcriptional regulator MurR [Oligella urethralis]